MVGLFGRRQLLDLVRFLFFDQLIKEKKANEIKQLAPAE